MLDPLLAVLTESTVARLASSSSFERGVGYLAEGRVGALRASVGRVAATVRGSESYAVRLSGDEGRLRFDCSCPVGRDGAFCKHCVAVALSWLSDHGAPAPALDDARAYLEALSPPALVDLLIDHAHDDERLARKLLLMATRPAGGASANLVSIRALIDQAFACNGFIHYREVWGYIRGIEETIDVLDGMLEEGRSADVVALAEHALAAVEHSLDHVDDSDGQMREVAERLEELHLDACRRATPDAVALAQRLFVREVEGEWDIFDRAVLRYADVLGEAGVAHYRALAQERWAGVPALSPGEDSRGRYGRRFRITRIMEALAELSGALAEQVAVRERDLASGYSFLQIAELCRSHGDDDAALAWAERGMAAFPDGPDPRLRAFLVDEYRRRDRIDDALELSLEAFVARPALETYRELATDARVLGQWERRREAALALLRDVQPDSGPAARHPSLRGVGSSELVRVFLWEGDSDAAWQTAVEGGCTRHLWLELADRRRAEHPADALTVYREHVEEIIDRKDKRAYEEAVRVIDQTIRPLFADSGRSGDFPRYVDEVRAAHKPKRNLMKLVDRLPPDR